MNYDNWKLETPHTEGQLVLSAYCKCGAEKPVADSLCSGCKKERDERFKIKK